MPRAAIYHIKIDQGGTYKEEFQWRQGDEKEEYGSPVKLYGYAGRCHIRNGAQNPGIIMEIPVEIIDPANGVFSLSLTAKQTSAIVTTGENYVKTNSYSYDVEFESSGGEVHRLLNGFVIVSPETTR